MSSRSSASTWCPGSGKRPRGRLGPCPPAGRVPGLHRGSSPLANAAASCPPPSSARPSIPPGWPSWVSPSRRTRSTSNSGNSVPMPPVQSGTLSPRRGWPRTSCSNRRRPSSVRSNRAPTARDRRPSSDAPPEGLQLCLAARPRPGPCDTARASTSRYRKSET